ncbi:MAG: peptide deformylase [Deltaproteobacteria bacterium]|nr:peptide deformylase [Deltaproteobacteria bacterium]
MALLDIVTYPKKILAQKTLPITDFKNKRWDRLISDMAETMYNAPGIGLAANQIGEPLRLAIIDITSSEDTANRALHVFFNPKILEKSKQIDFEEGCLSLPGVSAPTRRYEEVVVEFQDRQGNKKKLHTSGLLAVALQHEIDHLEGRLYIDQLSTLKKDLVIKRFKKLQSMKKSS